MENRQSAMQELFNNLESIDIKVPIGIVSAKPTNMIK